MNSHVLRCVHTDSDLIALHAQHGHRNFIADHYGLADTPSQYQHNLAPCYLAFERQNVLRCTSHRVKQMPTGILQPMSEEYKKAKRICYIFVSR
jgi:hypothetical protein